MCNHADSLTLNATSEAEGDIAIAGRSATRSIPLRGTHERETNATEAVAGSQLLARGNTEKETR
jgi:hypothetical protein